MSNKPKGAMGSPYCSSDGTSMADLMVAFDRLHENSWDGGKEAKKKREDERIEKINADIKEKLSKDDIPEGIELVTADVKMDENILADTPEINILEKTIFSPEIKKEMMQLILSNNLDINEVTDEQIIFTNENNNKFVILPL